jgi:outer membrane protein assembly factor BamB
LSRPAAALVAALLVVGACDAQPRLATSPSPALSPSPATSPAISVEWAQYHRDGSRSGAGPADPALTTPRVAWRIGVDGEVYASPLIVAGHVIVATENNTVYSLDIFTGATVWSRHLGDPVDASSLPCGNIRPVTGITGTPAADPASGRVYVAAFLRGYHHVLYALSLTDGSLAWQQTIDPVGSDPRVQQLRGALAIGNGLVYVPFGGLFGDCGAYHGYVVGVPLAGGQATAFRVPTATGASVWSPMGPSVAADGSVYVVTGNATSAASSFGYSDSVLQMSPDLHTVRSYFAPSNWAELNRSDTDLGSVGAALLPGGLVVSIGKEGVAYVLRAGALGGIGGQLASRKVCAGAWGGSAWSGSTVFVPCADGLVALNVSATAIDVAWSVDVPHLASPIVAAGAVWAIEPSTGTLYALDPSQGRNVLFKTSLGSANQFSTPAATEGFVVAPAGRSVVAVSVVG